MYLATAQPVRPPTDPYSCPACVWLRLGPRQANHIGLNPARDTVPVLITPLVAEWPDSPVPRPAAFRAPSINSFLSARLVNPACRRCC